MPLLAASVNVCGVVAVLLHGLQRPLTATSFAVYALNPEHVLVSSICECA